MLMWHARWRGTELMWHAGPAPMRRRTQGHMVGPHEPTCGTSGTQGVNTWREATQVHADAQVAPRGREGMAGEEPTG